MSAQISLRMSQIPKWALLVCTLPVILFSASGLAEGFPDPLLPGWVMIALPILSVALLFVLLAGRWIGIGLFLYSVGIGYSSLVILDEISSSYKTPFTILATLVVLIPVLVYLFSGWRGRWLVLVIGGFLVILALIYISKSYWRMNDVFGFTGCYPKCLPISGEQPHWWQVLIGAF